MADKGKHEPHGHAEHHGHSDHGEHHQNDHDDESFIHIDHKKYDIEHRTVTGAELRQIAKPPIGPDYDLYLETPGPGDDDKIADDRQIHLKPGMSFYSVLRQINPGARHGIA